MSKSFSTECKGSEGQDAEQNGIGNTMIGTGYGRVIPLVTI